MAQAQKLPKLSREAALKRTAQEFPERPFFAVLQLATMADECPRWWSPIRDIYLDKFWPTENFLAGAIFSIGSRNASFRYELTGPRDQVMWAQTLLSQADFGAGWQTFLMKITQDLLTQDNGAFMEIIRPARIYTEGKTYDGTKALDPETGEYTWHVLDPKTGKLIPTSQFREGFKVADSPLELPIGIAHLDSQRCLGRDTRVTMADGTRRSVVSLVREQHPGPVLSLDGNGQLVPKKVVGWYETKLGDRHWLRMHLHFAYRSFGRKEGLWLTDDHPVLTPDGWVEAVYLETGDQVVTSYPALSDDQVELLVGTLLGDASLAWWGGRQGYPKIALGHSEKQIEWLKLKMAAFQGLKWGPIRRHTRPSGDQRQTQCCVTPALLPWRDDWYPHYKGHRTGTKVVPRALVEANFTPLMLAAWYADDGNLQKRKKWGRPAVRLYTQGFPKSDVDWLVSLLNKHGYEARAYPVQGKHRVQYYIYLSPDGAERFLATVAPYLPPCLRHKLPEGYPDFDPGLWEDIAPARPFVDTIKSIEQGDYAQQTATFCLDVEDTHNFLAANMVVHNCTRTGDPDYPVIYQDLKGGQHKLAWHQVTALEETPSPRAEMFNVQLCAVSRVLRLAQILRDLTIYKHEKISGRFARAIHLTNIDPTIIQDAIKQAEESADSRGLLRYMQPIIAATLDPNAKPAIATLELASLPEGYDEEASMRWYISGLALVLGVDYGFLAPLPGSKLGTAAQAETQERQARGKSSRLFMQLLAHKLNFSGILPRSVVFKFAQVDPYEESERDRAFARRTRARSIAIRSGEITPEISSQMATDIGDLDPKYLAMMGMADISPIVTVAGNEMLREPTELTPLKPINEETED